MKVIMLISGAVLVLAAPLVVCAGGLEPGPFVFGGICFLAGVWVLGSATSPQ